MNKVFFNYADAYLAFPQKKKLKRFIEVVFFKENILLQKLSYVFCSDEYLLKINQQFLNHDLYTDIITFDLSEGKFTVGEIYISLERVRENARSEGISFKSEVLRVVIHGVLHLCGYNDKKKSEITKMRMLEEHYMRLYK